MSDPTLTTAREQLSVLAAEALEAFRAGLKGQIPGPAELEDLRWALEQQLAGRYLIGTSRDSADVQQVLAEADYTLKSYALSHSLDAVTVASNAVNKAIAKGMDIGFQVLSQLLLRAATSGVL